jgi:hypothetical protein
MYNLTFIFYLSFNHKEWGKTITKTDVIVPEAGRAPVAKRATDVPVIVGPLFPIRIGPPVPSVPTNVLFNFHFLAFLLITKGGEKQQRKPTRSRRPDIYQLL